MIHEIIIEDKEDKQVLVTLYDRIYIELAAELRTRLLSFIERGHTNFVVDFNNVDSIDCSGLGTLVAIHKKAMHLGGGRVTKESIIDLSVGVILRKKVGEPVSAGEVLADLLERHDLDLGRADRTARSAGAVQNDADLSHGRHDVGLA